jgi:hypothetical protein
VLCRVVSLIFFVTEGIYALQGLLAELGVWITVGISIVVSVVRP